MRVSDDEAGIISVVRKYRVFCNMLRCVDLTL